MKWYVVLALLLMTFGIWSIESRNKYVEVMFLDVGQGDAIFVEAPNGNQLLIDGGTGKSVLRKLSKVMPFYDRSIDVVLATHPDKDHIGGLPHVLDRYKVEYFLEGGTISDSGVYRALQERVDPILARRGMNIHLGSGVVVEILFPDREVSRVERNTGSVVARVVYGNTSFLLMGDSPKSIEKYLLSIDDLDSDVLKAGHHGSKTSSGMSFVKEVSPRFVVISAGKDNRYGHPHQEVMDLFADVLVYKTYEEGNITIVSDGNTAWLK